jgi:hypothetical protein
MTVSDWEKTGAQGRVDLHATSAHDFLQQMYYMCQVHNGANNEMGTTVAFTGMDGEPLLMMLIPYGGDEEQPCLN